MTVYLSLGSNTGDRLRNLRQAVTLICARFPRAGVRQSGIIETEPWGYASASPFLNMCISLTFASESRQTAPESLLDAFQSIEREISSVPHRNPDGSYRDRAIDIDIIAIDDRHISLPRLQIPHPRASAREFVLTPLAQIAPISLLQKIFPEKFGRTKKNCYICTAIAEK